MTVAKKVFFVLLFLISENQIFAMDVKKVDYSHFFRLCKNSQPSQVTQFIQSHPTMDINYKNYLGESSLLEAAYSQRWDNVLCLLQNGADRTIKNKDGDTLFFRLVSCSIMPDYLEKILSYYELKEINSICATIENSHLRLPINSFMNDILVGKKSVNSVNSEGHTALQIATAPSHFATRITLLKKAVNSSEYIDLSNNAGYAEFKKKAPLGSFIMREAFNNGISLSDTLLSLFLVDMLKEKIIPDVAVQIKQLYILLTISPLAMEAQLWKPVSSEICKSFGYSDINVNRSIVNVLSWSKELKTKINISLALQGK